MSLNKMTEKLNYNKNGVQDRLSIVSNIVKDHETEIIDYFDNYYNPHLTQINPLFEFTIIGKTFDSMATYILYSKEVEETNDKEIVNEYRKNRNKKIEASIDTILTVKDQRVENNRSIMKVSKTKVEDADRLVIPELAETGKMIDALTLCINNRVTSEGKKLSEHEVKRMMWIRTDIQKDEIVIKQHIKKPICFQNITKSEKNLHSLSYIRFNDAEIVRILIENYRELKEYSYDDTFGYLKIVILALEDLIEKTEFEPYIKDILVWKIEGMSYDVMLEKLESDYDMVTRKSKLSNITRETIPNMVVATYKQQKEDWVYTYKLKGTYKKCISCQTNKLANKKYFSSLKRIKSGLRAVCKECRKNKYKNDSVAKKRENAI